MAVCIFFRFTFYCFGTIVTLRTGSSPTDWVVTFGWSRNSKWMMRIYAARGDRMGVVDQYQACREALEDELGVPVSSETEALYQRLTS